MGDYDLDDDGLGYLEEEKDFSGPGEGNGLSKMKLQLGLHAAICCLGVAAIVALMLAAPITLHAMGGMDGGSSDDSVGGNGTCEEPGEGYSPNGPTFTFDDISDVRMHYASIQWVDTDAYGEGWTELDDVLGLQLFWFPDGAGTEVEPSSTVLYPANSWPEGVDRYILSPDSRFILFGFDFRQVCSLDTLACNDLVADENSAGDVRLVTWSPQNKLSYVLYGDLFVVHDASEPADSTIRVTDDGEKNHIINGAPDWVNEEEVLESNSASFWSPSSQYLAYLKYDELLVPEYSFPVYNTPDQYPGDYVYKYPCPGQVHSVVSLWVLDVEQGSTVQVNVGENDTQYLARVLWATDETVAFKRLSYLQQQQELLFADAATGESRVVTYNQDDAWLEQTDNLFFPDDMENVFVDSSIVDGFTHLFLYEMDTGDVIRQIESGDYEVDRVLAYDSDTSLLYFASRASGVKNLNLYRTTLSEEGPIESITPEAEGYYSASFSPHRDLFVLYEYGPGVPRTSMYQAEGLQLLKVLEDNAETAAYLATIEMPTREYRTFLSADGVTELPGFVLFPPGFDEEGSDTYPVLMNFYGGPGSQLVSSRFETNFWSLHSYLSTNMGFVVVTVDNRGTCCLGNEFTKQTYLKLGLLETDDQVAVAHQLQELSWVDSERIAVWGWSYGGFMSSRIATAGDSAIAAAVAVAPVTDWRFYDSIYTERYMQTPAANPLYSDSAVLGRSAGLGETAYLCIHGTGDDNVHFQNSADWVTELQQNGAIFQVMYYPDKTHSILGSATRVHLYNTIVNFLTSSFGITRYDGGGGGFAAFDAEYDGGKATYGISSRVPGEELRGSRTVRLH